MLLPNVIAGIEVSIEAVTALAAKEERLRTTIIAGLIATTGTGLGSMSGVNLDYSDTPCLGFVLDKGVQLGKAPTMQTPLTIALLTVFFTSPQLGSIPNVLEVFKDNGTARGGMLHDALGEDVIVVFAPPKLFAAQLLEVSLCRAAAFGLQLSSEAEGTPFLFLPPFLTEELAIAGDCWVIEAQVNTDHFIGGWDGRCGYLNHDMQSKPTLVVTQISTARLVAYVLHKVSRNGKAQFHTPVHSYKATGKCIPLDPIRTLVIANTGQRTVRATNRLESRNTLALFPGFFNPSRIGLLLFGLPGDRTLDGFRRLHTGCTDQLRRQLGILSTQRIVGTLVLLYAIATCRDKALLGNGIKATGMLLKGCLEDACLFWRWLQLDHYRTFHTESISYITLYCRKGSRIWRCPFSPPRG